MVAIKRALSSTPVTVLAFAAVSGLLAANGIAFTDFFRLDATLLVNPASYTINMLFHAGGWGHYTGNMWLWVPFGVALTWLTSNRHVFGVAVTVNALTAVVAIWFEGVGLGLSHVVLGVAAATLVRATGIAFQDASTQGLQLVVTALLLPTLGGLFLVLALAGSRWVADLYHLLGFLFGWAIEALYVFAAHDDESDTGGATHSIPDRLGPG
jgi:hypothetical protein